MSETGRPGRQELIDKYGSSLFDVPPLVTADRLEERLRQRDAVDQHFARISLEFAAGVLSRPGLDRRSRLLALIGQFAISKSYGHLEDALRASIEVGVSPRDSLEAVLMTQIYTGDTVMEPALGVFTRVAEETGVLASLRDDQLPLDGHDSDRDLDSERQYWPEEAVSDPRREQMMATYGWLGVSTGMRYRSKTHFDILEMWNDEDFARKWITFSYQGMYSRWVLDDKTRLLCTTADCLSGAVGSAREHMQEALHFGNSPREILELVFQSGVFFGFPFMSAGRKMLVSILEEEGRLDEIRVPRA